jgi:hypothetical protein
MLRSVFRNFQWRLTGYVNFLTGVAAPSSRFWRTACIAESIRLLLQCLDREAITTQFAVDGERDLVG